MLPTYMQQELMRRLSPERALVMAKSVGLDPASQPPALDRQIDTRLKFNAASSSSLQSAVRMTRCRCRAGLHSASI